VRSIEDLELSSYKFQLYWRSAWFGIRVKASHGYIFFPEFMVNLERVKSTEGRSVPSQSLLKQKWKILSIDSRSMGSNSHFRGSKEKLCALEDGYEDFCSF
jgi:hypothetical protein